MQHYELRSGLVSYMLSIPELLCGIGADGHQNYSEDYSGYESVENYLSHTGMAFNGTWGTDFEMSVLAHRLNCVVYSYNATGSYWVACLPHGIDRAIQEDVNCKSLYIYLLGAHFYVCGHQYKPMMC